MNIKRVFGIVLIFTGLFIILTGKIITGAVIGFYPENYLSILGILIFILGTFIIFMAKKIDYPKIPRGLEDIIRVSGEERNQEQGKKPKTQMHYKTPVVLLDTNPIITLAEQGYESILSQNTYKVYMLEHVQRELHGLSRAESVRGLKPTASRRIKNYVDSLSKGNPYFQVVRDPKLTENDEKYLIQKWQEYSKTPEGRRQTQYKSVYKDLLNVADGKIAASAANAAQDGIEVFVFTDDKALQGVIKEINKDLKANKKPLIIAGGLNDWEHYAKRAA